MWYITYVSKSAFGAKVGWLRPFWRVGEFATWELVANVLRV